MWQQQGQFTVASANNLRTRETLKEANRSIAAVVDRSIAPVVAAAAAAVAGIDETPALGMPAPGTNGNAVAPKRSRVLWS